MDDALPMYGLLMVARCGGQRPSNRRLWPIRPSRLQRQALRTSFTLVEPVDAVPEAADTSKNRRSCATRRWHFASDTGGDAGGTADTNRRVFRYLAGRTYLCGVLLSLFLRSTLSEVTTNAPASAISKYRKLSFTAINLTTKTAAINSIM
ncbi:hypothetical protein [Mycobacterium sp.]|uniref:hypothetical protein n=1 Tax=Mycobacterium sp. TaxID=1785 RepID=UPI00262B2EFF|nr:hypothetical protein [Mycobacterium sp.]